MTGGLPGEPSREVSNLAERRDARGIVDCPGKSAGSGLRASFPFRDGCVNVGSSAAQAQRVGDSVGQRCPER